MHFWSILLQFLFVSALISIVTCEDEDVTENIGEQNIDEPTIDESSINESNNEDGNFEIGTLNLVRSILNFNSGCPQGMRKYKSTCRIIVNY
jgi:hypothetical protein